MLRRASLLLVLVLLGLLGASAASAHPETCDQDGDNRFECDSPYRENETIGDNCPSVRNPDQVNVDRDEFGDLCDDDDDGDGHRDTADNCPKKANAGQEDDDGDGVGNVCNKDSDGDGVIDQRDTCPLTKDPAQADTDGDGVGDECDRDDDDDSLYDERDNCQFVSNEDQTDRDGDGIGTVCDQGESVDGGGPGGGSGGGTGDGGGGSGGGPGDGTGGGGGTGGPADRTAPVLRLGVARTQRTGDLEGGMPAAVRCSEACAITARLTVSRGTARRLKLRRTRLARGTAVLAGEGRTWVFLRVPAGVRRRVTARRAGRVRATLAVEAVDGAGNVRRETARLILRR